MVRVALAALPVVLSGCFDEPPLASPLVFIDDLDTGVGYQPFLGTTTKDTVTSDFVTFYAGSASMRFTVLDEDDPNAGTDKYSGGAFTASLPRDLSSFTALSFWAKTSRNVTFGTIGFANDNTGTSLYQTEWLNAPLTTTWTRYVIPVPAPGRLTSERGVLMLSAGAQGTPKAGFRAWFDEVKFETLDRTGWNPRPALNGGSKTLGPGETSAIDGTRATYTVEGRDVTVGVFPSAFDFQSSNPAVAEVSSAGLITAKTPGTATISASLDGLAAPQTIAVTVGAGLSPAAGPPVPTLPAADVIAIYSDAYADVAIDKMAADWSNGCSNPICPRWSEQLLGADTVSKYTDLQVTAIEFTGTHLVDATAMTHVHVDVWTKDATVFKVKLVDFGANGLFAGNDDSEHELSFTAASNPALVSGQWVSIDVPFTAFTGLTSRAHLAQFVMSASNATVFVDNVYFHK
jgi:hypothetical protein